MRRQKILLASLLLALGDSRRETNTMIRVLVMLLFLTMLASVTSAMAAQLVIVESTATKWPAGSIIDTAKPLSLAAGEALTLVGEDGTLLRLTGPSSGLPGGGVAAENGDKGVVQALSRLFAAKQPAASAWGTFRGSETLQDREAADPPEVWAWNLYRSDSICVPAGIEPLMWRADAARDEVVVLLHLSTGSEAELELAPGQDRIAWPKSVPLLDGGEYAIRDAGNLWERKLLVHVIPADQAGDIRRIAWMSDAGCLRQARLMVARLQ
jgi:hypothetical protein